MIFDLDLDGLQAVLQHQQLHRPPSYYERAVISTTAGATPAWAPAAASSALAAVLLRASEPPAGSACQQEATRLRRRASWGLGADRRRRTVQEEGGAGAGDWAGGGGVTGVDGDGGGLAVLRVPTAEQRADAYVPVAHCRGGQEGAHGLRRGSGDRRRQRRRGCRRHRRAPTDPQALASDAAATATKDVTCCPFSFTRMYSWRTQ